MHGRIARYSYKGEPRELASRAFGGEIFSFSAWDSGAAADAANASAATWVADTLGEELDLKEVHVGEVLFSTTLGVTTKAGMTA